MGRGDGSFQQTQQSVAGQFIGVNLYTYNERRRSVKKKRKKVHIFTHADISMGGYLSLLAADRAALAARWPTPAAGIDSGELHCKKRLAVFPSPAGISLTKLSLAGNI